MDADHRASGCDLDRDRRLDFRRRPALAAHRWLDGLDGSMTPAGWISAGLLVGGATLGSVASPPAARPPVAVGDFQMLAADFHVHAFPGDGSLAAWDIAREAGRRGLDVVAITNHNQTFAARLAKAASRPADVLLLAGDEITTPTFHLAAIGIGAPPDWRLPASSIASVVHAAGGAVILAHPVRSLQGSSEPATMASVDGIEAAHVGMHLDDRV